MKLISWNVNGIRAARTKGFEDYIRAEDPDIICLQETKAHPDQVGPILEDYNVVWNWAEKKGYSGTVIFTKKKYREHLLGIGIDEHDREGRVITVEFDDFFLVNVYTPNAQRELTRLAYRMKWDTDFCNYLTGLEKNKPVIFCGDLNVAHTEIDLANPKSNRGNAGFTDQERSAFSRLVDAGFIDSFREFNKDKGHYTWWSYMSEARKKNIGWRIDYFCMSPKLRVNLKEAFIRPNIMGSDHCPVGIIIS